MSHQKYVTGNAIIIIMSLKNQAITCQEIYVSLTGLIAPRRRRCKETLLARDLARSCVDQKRRQQYLL